MSRATEQQIRDLFRRLRTCDWRKLEDRLVAAIRHNSGPRLEADGYPTSVGGGGSGGSELTSVERAVEARLAGRLRDLALEHAAYAIQALDDAVKAANRIDHRLTLYENERKMDGSYVEPKVCESCARAGLTNPPAHRGNLGGRLHRDQWLCIDCYAYGNRNSELPTVEQLQHHERTGRWKVRIVKASIHHLTCDNA